MKDLRELDQYEQHRFSVCENLAKEYLATKKRQKCYRVSGTDRYSDGQRPLYCIIPLTDEQVAAIKSQMIEVANKVFPEEPVNSWEEFEEEILELGDNNYWDELNNTSGVWNDEIYFKAESCDMIPDSIDFDNVHYLYNFSAFVYEANEGQMSGPHKLVEELTDDEYAFLLALQLTMREGFTYNSLFRIDPEFAQKLNKGVDFRFFDIDCYGNQTKPFLIVFDELLEDVKVLKEEAERRLHDILFNND